MVISESYIDVILDNPFMWQVVGSNLDADVKLLYLFIYEYWMRAV